VAVARGLVTKNELRGPRYQRLYPDVYLPTPDEPPDLAARSRAAYLLVEHRDGVLGGYSSAILLGADCGPPNARAELIVPGGLRAHPGLLIHRATVAEADRWRSQGCLVTSPERTAWDLTRRLDLMDAVVAVDALARVRAGHAVGSASASRFVPADLLRRRELEPGTRGIRRLDRVVALANPKAESPMETRLRLLIVLGGMPTPEVQYALYDEYGFVVARFDLAYPDALLAIEYDGHQHRRREFSNDDRWRDGATGDYGWHTMRFGRDDVLVSAARTVQLVRNQLEHRLRLHRRASGSSRSL